MHAQRLTPIHQALVSVATWAALTGLVLFGSCLCGCADTKQMRMDLAELEKRQDAADRKLSQLVRQVASALASLEAAIAELDKADAADRRGQ